MNDYIVIKLKRINCKIKKDSFFALEHKKFRSRFQKKNEAFLLRRQKYIRLLLMAALIRHSIIVVN